MAVTIGKRNLSEEELAILVTCHCLIQEFYGFAHSVSVELMLFLKD